MDYLDKAVSNIWVNRKIALNDREIVVAILLNEDKWQIINAPWWKRKQASIIGADYSGNFILRLSNGAVCLWDHSLEDTIEISNSVKGFVSMLEKDTDALP